MSEQHVHCVECRSPQRDRRSGAVQCLRAECGGTLGRLTAAPPRVTAPDATAGDGLRTRAEAICMDMPGIDYDDGGVSWHRQIDYIETALRDVLAAAARDAEKVRRVEAIAVDYERTAKALRDQALDSRRHRFHDTGALYDDQADDLQSQADRIRRALDAP